MYKQQVVQKLYDDADGVRPCEFCGCRFDRMKMHAHVQRYGASALPSPTPLRWCWHVYIFISVVDSGCVNRVIVIVISILARSHVLLLIRMQSPPRRARDVLENAPLVSRPLPPLSLSLSRLLHPSGSSSATILKPEST